MQWENHCYIVCIGGFWINTVGYSSDNHWLHCTKLMDICDALLQPSRPTWLFPCKFPCLVPCPQYYLSSLFLIEPIMRIFISLSFTIKTVRNVSTAQGMGFQSCWLLPAETSVFQWLSTEIFNIFLCGKGKVFRYLIEEQHSSNSCVLSFRKILYQEVMGDFFFSQYATRLIFRFAAMLWKLKVDSRKN